MVEMDAACLEDFSLKYSWSCEMGPFLCFKNYSLIFLMRPSVSILVMVNVMASRSSAGERYFSRCFLGARDLMNCSSRLRLIGFSLFYVFMASRPSSPYRNCMMSLWSHVLTVISYMTTMSYRILMSLLCMYPVSAVFTAVSMRPSLPPMVWKKNSVAVNPEKKLFFTNPRDSGVALLRMKWGSVRSIKP